jgi:hypothetical protein
MKALVPLEAERCQKHGFMAAYDPGMSFSAGHLSLR